MKMDTCILCKSSKKDDVLYGEFLKKNKIGVHTYCLYLSSNLSQNGADDEGFLGFLEADIRKEVKRISLLKCFYCHKAYANIGCCANRCRRTFHFICGLENNCENQFNHDFRSFCHRDLRKVQQRPAYQENCLICYENLIGPNEKFNKLSMIQAPCCHNGWFHKLCLQKFAKTAGYFFKCPLCNDAKIFREKLPANGIFIPNQDAAWELEPNAFAELLERPSECAAVECKNKRGRKSKNDQNPFVMCSTCGSTAMHLLCLENGAKKFHCADCTIAIEQDDSGRGSLNTHRNHQGRRNFSEEDEEVDVCNVSDNEDLMIIQGLAGRNTNVDTPIKREGKKNLNCKPGYKPCTESNKNRYNYISEHSSDDFSESSLVEDKDDSYRPNKRCSINSISSNDSDIKPVSSRTASKTVKRCSTTSISSDDSNIKPISSKTASKTVKHCSTTSISSDDSDIKPVSSKTASKTAKRCSTTSISSDDSDIKPVSSKKDKLSSTSSVSSDDSNIKPVSSKKDKLCSTTSISSDDSHIKASKKRSLILISDSEDEEQQNLPQKTISKVRETKARPKSRKENGQSTRITSDTDTSDDEVEVKSSKNSSILTDFDDDDDDTDDDPLENFTEIIQRQKNISCIAMRTRKQSHYVERPQELLTISEDSNTPAKASSSKTIEAKSNKNEDSKGTTSHFKPLKTDFNTNTLKASQVLEGSFIAKRTRRKSMACMRNNNNSQKENLEVISTTNTLKSKANKALNSRRRTICASSAKERHEEMSKIYEKLHESDEDNNDTSISTNSSSMERYSGMSQIYENLHESEEDKNGLDEQLYDFMCIGSSSSDEEELIEKSSLKDIKVPNDDYDGHNINLEISCIANRTRKRKSIKNSRQSLDQIEDAGSSYSSTTSTTSYSTLKTSSSSRTSFKSLTSSSTSSTDNSLHNVNSKKRRSHRLSSSEDSESFKSRNSLKKRTISPEHYEEKCPQRNLSVFLNSKFVSKSSLNSASIYYPQTQYHPHSNNHRRV